MTTHIIDSKERVIGTTTEFTLRLATHLKAGWYRVKWVSIPASAYNVHADSNTFGFQFNGAPAVSQFSIPPGYYSVDTLISALNQSALRWTFDRVSGRLSVTHPDGLVFRLLPGAMGGILGFEDVTVYNATHTGQKTPNLACAAFYLISIGGASRGVLTSTGHWGTAIVPITSDQLDYTSISERQFRQTFYLDHPTRELHLSLRDSNGRPAQLHGADWYMLIERT